MSILHQAVASDTGQVYTWTAGTYDNGAGYPGTGTPTNILVIAGIQSDTSIVNPTWSDGTHSYAYGKINVQASVSGLLISDLGGGVMGLKLDPAAIGAAAPDWGTGAWEPLGTPPVFIHPLHIIPGGLNGRIGNTSPLWFGWDGLGDGNVTVNIDPAFIMATTGVFWSGNNLPIRYVGTPSDPTDAVPLSSLASYLPLAGGTMSGAIAMGAHKVTGLANGTNSNDAAAFGQIPVAGTTAGTFAAGNDSRITGALPLAGGTMSGAIAMGAYKVTGLANGTASNDAAAFGQIPVAGTTAGTFAAGNDTRVVNALNRTGDTMTGDLGLGAHTLDAHLGNVYVTDTPASPNYAINKNKADTLYLPYVGNIGGTAITGGFDLAAYPIYNMAAQSTVKQTISSDALTTILTVSIGPATFNHTHITWGARVTVCLASDHTKTGAIDVVFDTNLDGTVGMGNVQATLIGAFAPDYSRLPSALAAVQIKLATPTNSVVLEILRPAGVSIIATTRLWRNFIEDFS